MSSSVELPPPSAEAEVSDGGFVPRVLRHLRLTMASSLRRFDPFQWASAAPPASAPAAACERGDTAAAERLRADLRLIAILSAALALSETGRALILLRRQSRTYGKQRAALLAAAEPSAENATGAGCSLATSAPHPVPQPSPAAATTTTMMGIDGDEETAAVDADDDKDIRTKTPLQLVHYWKQMERAVLTSSNRRPFRLPLPERSCDVFDPQAKRRQRELIPASHATLCPVTKAVLPSGSDPSTATAAAAAGDSLSVLVLPIEGCFLYEHRPDIFDFAWREADELEAQRIKRDVAAEERARRLGQRIGQAGDVDGGGDDKGAMEAGPPRPVLPPSASSRGLMRFDSTEATLLARQPSSWAGGAVAQPHDATWRPPLKWEAFFLLWGFSVDYSVTIREVRQLLLSASPPAFLAPAMTHGDGPTPFDVSSANLSLLWLLANLRAIYTAIVVHGDVQRCADEMEELDTYMSVIYKKCIARWPAPTDMNVAWQTARDRNNVWLVCAVQGSWQVLSATYDELRAIRFRQSLSGVRQLVKYMYASSKTKYVSAVLIAALTALNSRVTSAGRVLRERINEALSDADGDLGGGTAPMSLSVLCGYELGRLALNYVLVHTTSEFIALTAGLRKDAVRAELYEALAHMPLGYFDVRPFDEIESVVYSVDDLEGIDVQINQYVFGAVNTVLQLRESLSDVHSGRVFLVAATTASLPHVIEYVGKRVRLWYDDLLRAGSLPWLLNPSSRLDAEQEAYNTDGVLLRGTEIIGAVHQLRPYGADTRLTHWWNTCTQYDPSHPSQVEEHNINPGSNDTGGWRRAGSYQQPQSPSSPSPLPAHHGARGVAATSAAGVLPTRLVADVKESGYFLLDAVRTMLRMPYGKLIPGAGKGILDLADWLLPVFVNALGARWCGLSSSETFRLLDCASAMESGVSVVVEGFDVAQMLLENGYKAAMLERVLDASCWETTSTAESRYLKNYVNTREERLQPPASWRRESAAQATNATGSLQATADPTALVASPVLRPPAARGGLQLRPPSVEVDYNDASLYRHYLVSAIYVHNVQFQYPSTPTVNVFKQPFTGSLHLLSESLPTPVATSARASAAPSARGRRGRLVCLTGPSGCGKSSLLQLLLALYTNYDAEYPDARVELELLRRGGGCPHHHPRSTPSPEGDAHVVEGHGSAYHWSLPPTLRVDIRSVPVDVLRGRLFSYVPQTPTVFSGSSIAQNVSLAGFVSIATDNILEKVEHCAALAGCGAFVRQLPGGLLTRICDASSMWCSPTGADGRAVVRLTPDQLQRIMVARALYHGGQVLLMDEPTANLEATAAAAMRDMWRSLLEDGTVKGIICVTHDAELLAEADEVIAFSS